MTTTPKKTSPTNGGDGSAPAQAPAVKWNTSQLQSSYANVCSVTSTREEVVLNFGINQAWERGQPEVEIQLTNRIILSPFAAKRMATALTKLISDYETRYGAMKTGAGNE